MKMISKICCTKCKDCKGISKDRVEKLVAKFGSLEQLIKTYVCRKCRKELNVRSDGVIKPPKQTRNKKLADNIDGWVKIIRNWPKLKHNKYIDLESREGCIAWEKTWRFCREPHIWEKNHGACDGCIHYPHSCAYEYKILKAQKKENRQCKKLNR